MDKPASIGNILWGLLFIGIGGYFLASQLGYHIAIDFSVIWPLFLIVPGLTLWITYWTTPLDRRLVGQTIPATLLTMLGGLFMVFGFLDWRYVAQLSFMFPLIIAVAFWIAWLLGRRGIGFLIPALILTLASGIVFGVINLARFLVPLVFFGAGLLFLLRGNRKPR